MTANPLIQHKMSTLAELGHFLPMMSFWLLFCISLHSKKPLFWSVLYRVTHKFWVTFRKVAVNDIENLESQNKLDFLPNQLRFFINKN